MYWEVWFCLGVGLYFNVVLFYVFVFGCLVLFVKFGVYFCVVIW